MLSSYFFSRQGGVYLIGKSGQMYELAELVAFGEEIEPGVAAAKADYRLVNDLELAARKTTIPTVPRTALAPIFLHSLIHSAPSSLISLFYFTLPLHHSPIIFVS